MQSLLFFFKRRVCMFTDELVAAMKKEGLTVKDLADLVGVKYHTAYNWVHSKTKPKADTRNKIEEILEMDHSPETKKVFSGVRLLEKREQYGYSQETLGKMLGVSSRAVYSWEKGEAQPSLVNVRSLCSIFGVKEDDFYRTTSIKEDYSRMENTNKNKLEGLSEELDNRIDALDALIKDYAARVEELEDVVSKLDRHDAELKSRFDKMADFNSRLDSEQFEMTNDVERCEASVELCAARIDKLEKRVDYDPTIVKALATAILKGGAA